MSPRVSGKHLLFIGLLAFVDAQPIFPDGVSSVMNSVSTRQKGITSTLKDDSDKVSALVRGSSTAIQGDLLEEAVQQDLQQA